MKTTNADGLIYYHLEEYLFETVSERFEKEKTLNAFDFFCIIIWKANRAKSLIANNVLKKAGEFLGKPAVLEEAIELIFKDLGSTKSRKEKFCVLVDKWKFRLPTASAILTVLFPKDFSVYDVRVCEILDDFRNAKDKPNAESMWEQYETYIKRVRDEDTKSPELRDKDRALWGRSFADQLNEDVRNHFVRNKP